MDLGSLFALLSSRVLEDDAAAGAEGAEADWSPLLSPGRALLWLLAQHDTIAALHPLLSADKEDARNDQEQHPDDQMDLFSNLLLVTGMASEDR